METMHRRLVLVLMLLQRATARWAQAIRAVEYLSGCAGRGRRNRATDPICSDVTQGTPNPIVLVEHRVWPTYVLVHITMHIVN